MSLIKPYAVMHIIKMNLIFLILLAVVAVAFQLPLLSAFSISFLLLETVASLTP